MLPYVLLSVMSILAGLGALRIFAGRSGSSRVLMAPAVLLSLWAVFLGASIPLGIPVRMSWNVIFGITVVLAVVGLAAGGRELFAWRHSKWMAVALALPPLLLYPYVIYGVSAYAGAPAWDGWSYVANGRYLWEYPLGSEGGLRPLYQYGAHLAETRFVATGLLGLLSPLTLHSGETHMARGLFLFWTFFVAASSVLYCAVQRNWRPRATLLYGVLAICSGWLLLAVSANNYDNLLILAILPAFAAWCRDCDMIGWRGIWLTGLLLAGLQYCYAELSAVAMFVGMAMILGRSGGVRAKARFMALSLGAGILALAPYWRILAAYFCRQFVAAGVVNATRPGEGFIPEILRANSAFPVFWGTWLGSLEAAFPAFGAELLAGAWIAALGLALLFLLGCRALLQQGDWAPVTASACLICASLYFIGVKNYDYAAYKMLLLNWWLMSLLIVLGLEQVLTGIGNRFGRIPVNLVWGGALICFLSLGWGKMSLIDRAVAPKTMQPYEIIRTVAPAGAAHPVALLVDDDIANAWAVYFLRENPLTLLRVRHYMAQPYTRNFMDRAERTDPRQAEFVITDQGQCADNASIRVVQPEAGKYCVLQALKPDWSLVMRIDNPNGRERAGGSFFYWLGRGSTVLHVFSMTEKTTQLRLDLMLGPSLPGNVPRTLQVASAGDPPQAVRVERDGPLDIRIHLRVGDNKIVLTPLDRPSVPALPNGDDRPLILRLNAVSFEP